MRLQQVAADVGISHPTVLHHFGTRELLLQAVVVRALASLHADVVEAIATLPPGNDRVELLLERVFEALDRGGHGRALAWLALSGMSPPESDRRLREVAVAAHSMRRQRHGARRTPPFEDTLFVVMLALSTVFAQSVAGGMLARTAGLDEGPAAGARFRKWLARLLVEHLSKDLSP